MTFHKGSIRAEARANRRRHAARPRSAAASFQSAACASDDFVHDTTSVPSAALARSSPLRVSIHRGEMNETLFRSAAQAAEMVARREVSLRELTELLPARIDAVKPA